jgi:GTP-binding protein
MIRFIDEAKIYVRSGRGGKGCVSFRREKFVPRGGPDGGNGGNGGDIVLKATANKNSLLDHRYKQHYRAKNGQHGSGKNQHGKSAPSLIIPVPIGTVVKNYQTDEIIGDLVLDGQEIVVARGGRGGKGNSHFKTSVNRAPKYAEQGEEGEEKTVKLELKLLADVSVIGFPNAGKSTLISKISAAHPKVADYPFTTLTPNLGVVSYDEGKTFVVADVPGLIKGAHAGAGLGIRFLKHIERSKVIIHLIDMSPLAKRDPVEDYKILNNELDSYSPDLKKKPQIVALNKIDINEAEEKLVEIRKKFKKIGVEVFPISALTGEGIKEIIREAARHLRVLEADIPK